MNHISFIGTELPKPNEGWDFTDSQPDPLSAIHPYPAKFISNIPRKLIKDFPPQKGLALLDPFCGSGTSLSEAQAAGIPSIGVDVNPIAVMISRVRLSEIPAGVLSVAEQVELIARADLEPRLPMIPRLNHWFKPRVQLAIASLTGAIEENSVGGCKELLRLALSSIIVRVSNQDSDTRYAAVDKAVDAEDVYRLFGAAVKRTVKALESRPARLADVQVIEADVLTIDRRNIERPIGLVVTSPPYPNAYEYWLYHKYRMWWLGLDPLAVKEREIGARAHFFKGRKSHTAQDFERQMTSVLGMLRDVMVTGGHACFVVGRSLIRGETVDNAKIIADAGAATGFCEVMRAERVIAASRKSFNLSHANIKTETVLVMRKGN
ncbi:DNA methyltransferase [Ancylobacter rudongensis]|uniref:site-specific DNA-methyltransferase (cytosine-N(4)-specific) n=1 Tax=Ancylobacter rudongensis TaxID=177413 RepID=A0A1G4UTM9_9HYPH|nr:DNA methyltransferase [Ancylobacter rudongensis]SCW97000.1 site-specific DNA-methyltransferase (cytosine-N4-specific) [Ancylobacter rudongensis]